ncbi:hypothetical protein CBS147324_7490 [Aspergillus niger]|nr:hypothetical protein CBS147324_7490 [Aspergillus niger]
MAPAGNGRDLACSYLPESPGCDRSRLRQDPGWPTIVGKAHINPFPKRAIHSLRGACLQCLDFKLPPRLLVVQCLCDFPNQAFSQNSVGLDPSFDPPPTTQ